MLLAASAVVHLRLSAGRLILWDIRRLLKSGDATPLTFYTRASLQNPRKFKATDLKKQKAGESREEGPRAQGVCSFSRLKREDAAVPGGETLGRRTNSARLEVVKLNKHFSRFTQRCFNFSPLHSRETTVTKCPFVRLLFAFPMKRCCNTRRLSQPEGSQRRLNYRTVNPPM